MEKKTIVIAGGSGLVGQALVSHIDRSLYDIYILSRQPKESNDIHYIAWDTINKTIDLDFCPDIIINLAGEGIADSRWTADRKKKIINSRVDSAKTIAHFLKANNYRPEVYISASAIGYYGSRGDELLTETSHAGEGFMSDCCQKWEDAASLVATNCDRYVILRFGIVLSMLGGALPKMLMTKGFGIYNYFGDGSQYYSWIHIDDVCRMITASASNPLVKGIYNAVSPHPIRHKQFIKDAMVALNSNGLLIPVPRIALDMTLGEMSAVVLDSVRVSAAKWEGVEGFEFRYSDLKEAVRSLVNIKS